MDHTRKRGGLPRALGAGLAILGISLPVFAVDGVIEINQAAVNAAGGFPFVINTPGSYRLTGNLTVPAETTAIQIAASQVTLDLNGFAILGPLRGYWYRRVSNYLGVPDGYRFRRNPES